MIWCRSEKKQLWIITEWVPRFGAWAAMAVRGEYVSKEMIQAHEGLFGMELQMWERIRDQIWDYADEDFWSISGAYECH